MLNVGLSMEVAQLDTTGAEGIGLFRTEIAMLARGSIADVAEQAASYSRVLDVAAGRPVLFRTLDLGADKLLPGDAPEEENPAMGWRSLRIGLDRPALLRRQLRALLLAAGGRPLSVMFPMVATVAEFRAARALLLAEARADTSEAGDARHRHHAGGAGADVAIGRIVARGGFRFGRFERSAAVPVRRRPRHAIAVQPLRPAVAAGVESAGATVAAARAAEGGMGVPVSLCGEAASRPLEAMALVGLGFASLSMPASGILPVKAMLAGLDLAGVPASAGGDPRQHVARSASLREPISTWAREHGLAGLTPRSGFAGRFSFAGALLILLARFSFAGRCNDDSTVRPNRCTLVV